MNIEDVIKDIEMSIKMAEDIHSTNVVIDIDSAITIRNIYYGKK